MYAIEHYDKIITAFEGLLAALNELCLHIHDDLQAQGLPAVIEAIEVTIKAMETIENKGDGAGGFVADRDKVLYALKQFEPNTDLLPQATETFPGAVACTESTLKLIDAVNAAKDAFKTVANDYKSIFKENPTKPVRDALRRNGFGLVNLKQVYRHIHYVTYHPARIAWTQVKGFQNVVISIEQAKQFLLNLGSGAHIDIQLAKLALLKPSTKLVRQYPIKSCSLVNLTYKELGKTQHHKITTSLPVFYVTDPKKEPPTVCFSAKASRGEGSVRADKKIEAQPFLKSINAYRYRDTC